MRQVALLVAVVCVLAAPAVAGPAAGPAGQAATAQEDVSRSGVDITIQLQPDGDARWNISARYALEDANDSAAFTRIAERFKAGETDNGFSLDVFESVAPTVSERVGRPMDIRAENPRRARTIDHGNNSTGVLSLEFTWTNFTRVSGEEYIVDSFSGTWFGDLAPGQTLTIRPPEGYERGEQVLPEAAVENGGYQWTGPQEFQADRPRVVFSDSSSAEQQPLGSPLTLAGVGVLALAVGGVIVWAYQYGREDDVVDDEAPAPERAHAANGGSSTGQTTSVKSGGERASAGGGAAVDSELLSDEERVERMLEANGGRMKQAKIVEETRWSNAKVSQLLSSMADEGRVEKLRIGRENLISLPGEGVTDDE